MSILNRKVSQFAGVNHTTPATVSLLDWLKADFRAEMECLRQLTREEYKIQKKKLPAITPSGTFSKRAETELIQHSGLVQFDIDNVSDPESLKRQLMKIPFIAYCGLSISGQGLWGLIPISEPSQHKAHFRAIKQAFLDMGVSIDPAPQNVASLRFASYDSQPYFNHEAQKFPYKLPVEPRTRTVESTNRIHASEDSEVDKVEACIHKIEKYKIDITGDYPTWFQIGSAILGTLGAQSRDWFHRISQFSPKYSPEELNRYWEQWTQAKASANIGVFYNACKNHGILFSNCYAKEKASYGHNHWTGEEFDERGYPSSWDAI